MILVGVTWIHKYVIMSFAPKAINQASGNSTLSDNFDCVTAPRLPLTLCPSSFCVGLSPPCSTKISCSAEPRFFYDCSLGQTSLPCLSGHHVTIVFLFVTPQLFTFPTRSLCAVAHSLFKPHSCLDSGLYGFVLVSDSSFYWSSSAKYIFSYYLPYRVSNPRT